MQILTNLDLAKNELQNARVQNLASDPASPVEGQIYHNTTTHTLRMYNGTSWVDIEANGVLSVSGTAPIVSSGGQTPAISITAATGAADGSMSAADKGKLDAATNLATVSTLAMRDASGRMRAADPSDNADVATKGYVDTMAQGLDVKASVRVATTANITRSGPQTIDGISAIAGDRVLVKNQTAPAENGIYIVAAGAWSRAADADTWAELVSAYVWVEVGTAGADSGWLCTVDQGGTLNTTAVTWVQFNGAGQITAGAGLTKTGNTLDVGAGNGISVAADSVAANLDAAGGLEFNGTATRVKLDGATLARSASGLKVTDGAFTRKYTTTIGDGATTSIVVTHNLNTMTTTKSVRLTGGTMDEVYPDIQTIDANSIRVLFTVAPTAGQYTVTVIG